MPIKFQSKITEQDMFRFNIHHTYTRFSGVFGIFVGLGMFVYAFATMNRVPFGSTVMYAVFGLIFLAFMPLNLRMRSKRQFLMNPTLSDTFQYLVDEEGIHLTILDHKSDLPWDHIYKISSNKSYLWIYSSRMNAYIIPKKDLGNQYDQFLELAKSKLDSYRYKVK